MVQKIYITGVSRHSIVCSVGLPTWLGKPNQFGEFNGIFLTTHWPHNWVIKGLWDLVGSWIGFRPTASKACRAFPDMSGYCKGFPRRRVGWGWVMVVQWLECWTVDRQVVELRLPRTWKTDHLNWLPPCSPWLGNQRPWYMSSLVCATGHIKDPVPLRKE